jgi:hypothetical protein
MDVYLAVKMPWPLSPRDFKIQRVNAKGADGAVVMSRSIEDGDAAKKRAERLGRVRGDLKLGGYFLEKSGVARECTKVVYMLEGHLGGVMNLDMLNKMASGPQIQAVVDNCTVLEEEAEDEEEGRGSSLFVAPRKWLRTIGSGAAELGGGVVSREERRRQKEEARRAFEATAPGYTGEPEKPPPPPPGAPPPNNDIFDKLRLQREAAAKAGGVVEIELTANPLQKGGVEGRKKERAMVDERKLQSLDSFNATKIKAKAKGEKTGGDNATLSEAAPPQPPPAKEPTWVQYVDEKSGHPFYESSAGETSWDEPFAREGKAWRSLVDGRVVHEAPQNVAEGGT